MRGDFCGIGDRVLFEYEDHGRVGNAVGYVEGYDINSRGLITSYTVSVGVKTYQVDYKDMLKRLEDE